MTDPAMSCSTLKFEKYHQCDHVLFGGGLKVSDSRAMSLETSAWNLGVDCITSSSAPRLENFTNARDVRWRQVSRNPTPTPDVLLGGSHKARCH